MNNLGELWCNLTQKNKEQEVQKAIVTLQLAFRDVISSAKNDTKNKKLN